MRYIFNNFLAAGLNVLFSLITYLILHERFGFYSVFLFTQRISVPRARVCPSFTFKLGGCSPRRWTGLKRTRLNAPWSKSQFLRRARSLASFALLRRQQITINASNGNPRMQDTIGMIILSGVTERCKYIRTS